MQSISLSCLVFLSHYQSVCTPVLVLTGNHASPPTVDGLETNTVHCPVCFLITLTFEPTVAVYRLMCSLKSENTFGVLSAEWGPMLQKWCACPMLDNLENFYVDSAVVALLSHTDELTTTASSICPELCTRTSHSLIFVETLSSPSSSSRGRDCRGRLTLRRSSSTGLSRFALFTVEITN